MSAIYGILGESDPSELTAIGDRMGHRGKLKREWSPALSVRYGQRFTDFESAADGSIVFDGMLDNAPQLVASLDLVPGSDQEIPHWRIARELYHRYGRDGFGRLSGQFAIALWDEADKQLVMARDRWGARPLYYTRNRERILFASEYKALLAVPEVPARCNREAILYALRTRHGDPNACFLAGIEVVPRGSWSVVQSERIESERFWDITIDIVPRSEHEHAAALRSALLNALLRQMAPFQQVGLALSGGLDSALVLAGMRKVSPEQVVHTFTAGYGPEDGEIIRAGEAARYFQTVHHEVIMGAAQLPALLPEAVWHMEEPVGGEEMIYQFVAAREAAKHV
ncbi:MAG: asparagine synthetase B family protein, partial [Gammaproteobacteria bacterium]